MKVELLVPPVLEEFIISQAAANGHPSPVAFILGLIQAEFDRVSSSRKPVRDADEHDRWRSRHV